MRLASVWVPALRRPAGGRGDGFTPTRRLAASLLAGSPRVMIAAPGLCRVDAAGWERRGGEDALARRLREAAVGATTAGVGIADVAVAADAAARLAHDGDREFHIVPPGASRAFLAPLPPAFLPLSDDLREVFRTLGIRTIGQIAGRERAELEARFGPAGIRAHRRARGEDDRLFRPLAPEEPPGARLELEGPVGSPEPLLFVLRHLIGRIHEDLAGEGRCARTLLLRILLEGGRCREMRIVPARPTRSESLLFDLCRTELERSSSGGEDPEARVVALELRVVERASAIVRQGDLFAARSRDPLAAVAVLARLRARLGDDVVVRPAPRPDHRPEVRNAWRSSPLEPPPDRGPDPDPAERRAGGEPIAGVLRLLPRPVPVRVETGDGRPTVLEDACGRQDLVAAEGPERLSGEWWGEPYRREYFRVLTSSGELLWLFRDRGAKEGSRWHLHGWWD